MAAFPLVACLVRTSRLAAPDLDSAVLALHLVTEHIPGLGVPGPPRDIQSTTADFRLVFGIPVLIEHLLACCLPFGRASRGIVKRPSGVHPGHRY
jgi:hypothetical protein